MESTSTVDHPEAKVTENPEQSGLVTVPSDVILQELGDEIVVANLDTGVYFALNEVSARVWALLREVPSLDAVVSTLLTEYEIDETTVRTDLEGLIEQFKQHGLMFLNHA